MEGHETMQMLGAYLGLRHGFSDYSRFSAPETPTTSILPYYSKVSAALGATVLPPRKLLQNVVEDLLIEGRGAAARGAYNTLVSGYGTPEDSAKLLTRIAEVERRPAPAETVEGLLATPFPTPDEARAFIGDWLGDVRVTPQGITWGNMNGMRPRGVNLFEGTLKGDTLAGTVRFGGIDFRLADGSPPEPLHFSFKRVR